MCKLPAVRGVSRGGEDCWAVDDLVLHVVALGQSQGVGAMTSMQNWEKAGWQKKKTKITHLNIRET